MQEIKYIVVSILSIVMISCTPDPFSYEQLDSGVEFSVSGVKKRITFFDDHIVRVSAIKPDGQFKDSSLVVLPGIEQVQFQLKDQEQLLMSTNSLQLRIDKQTGAISFFDANGNRLTGEHQSKPTSIADTVVLDSRYYKVRQTFQLDAEEAVYGLGQYQDGHMNYRGKEVLMVQSNRIAVVPVLVSTKNYGILWDNYSRTMFEDSDNGMSFTSEVADQMDYYFINGNNLDGVVSGYRQLTGKAPLFAKKAYGFWQSKERYQSFDELHDVVEKYRQNNLPLDNIVQDWRYWGENTNWTSMYFEPEHFPNPKDNIKRLHEQNVDFMVSIWPAIGSNTNIYRDMEARGFLLSPDFWAGGKVYDAYNPEARDLYWSYIKDGLADNGLDAYWMDGTEPEFSDTESQENTEGGLLRASSTHLGPTAKYLNSFSLVTTEGVYNKHRSYTDDKRVFILTRSAFSGQQRNAAVTWSGDISASYLTFKRQISAGLNFCLTGIPYWSHDIGAFYPSGKGGLYPFGLDDPAYQELYVRWFQFGVFTPIFRAHGTGTPREVWQFKDRNPTFYQALKKSLNLRYELMPYIYSNAWQVTENDYTLMRGLAMDFAYDKNTWNIGDQYMFGPAFLVKPIAKEMYHRATPFPPVVEGQNLRNPSGEQGLKVTFFKDRELNTSGFTGNDTSIDYNWAGGGLPPGIPENNFSVRWEGKLIATETGIHKLVVEADDGVRAWLDGELIIDGWIEQGATPYDYMADLKAGASYDLKIEYFQAGGGAQIRFVWETPSYIKRQADQTDLDKTEEIYLPAQNGWYDFWTNQYYQGGQSIEGTYLIDIFPLFVKAGSIVPMKQVQQYVNELPDLPLEIRIYSGADADFTYYEDEGNNYNYEKGAFNTIGFEWDDLDRSLKIGQSDGSFSGFKKEKTIKVTLIGKDADIDPQMKELLYDGQAMEINFKPG